MMDEMGLSPMGLVAVAVLLGVFVWGPLGMWVAIQKAREAGEGYLLGLIFGPFGILIEAMLPVGTAAKPPRERLESWPATSPRTAAEDDGGGWRLALIVLVFVVIVGGAMAAHWAIG